MKNHLIFILLFLTTTSIVAGEVMSFEKRKDKIYITADTCEEVDKQVSQISKWGKQSKGKICTKAESRGWWIFSNDGCEANISNCLPKHVTKYHGSNPDTDGPNCWNLSLVMAKILPNLRYSTPEEMSFFMQPPLCRLLENNEERIPGDIGAIRNQGKEEVHGFIYVSDQIAYSKNGYSRRSPYELQTLENVYDTYDIANADQEKCLQNKMDPSCKSGVEYYRCISMKDYLKQENNKSIIKTEKIITNLNKAECYTSEMAFNIDAPLEQQTLDTISTSILAINRLLKDQTKGRKIASLSEADTFIIASTKLRIDAMKGQLDLIRYGYHYYDRSDTIGDLVRMLHESQKELDEITK